MKHVRSLMVVGLMSLVIALSGCGSKKALFQAIEMGDSETLKQLVQDKVNFDVVDSKGNSPIYYALKNSVAYEKVSMAKSQEYAVELKRITDIVNEKYSKELTLMNELGTKASAKITELEVIAAKMKDAGSMGQLNALSRESKFVASESRTLTYKHTAAVNDYIKKANEYKQKLAKEDVEFMKKLDSSNKAYRESKKRRSIMTVVMYNTKDKKGIRIDGMTVPEYVVGTKRVAEYISKMSAFK